jgi:hypothetical protein
MPGQESASASGQDRAAKRTRIRARIGGQGTPESGTDRQRKQQGRATHRLGTCTPQQTDQQLKLSRAEPQSMDILIFQSFILSE